MTFAYPGMWSHVQLKGDTPYKQTPLPDYYTGDHYWKYFHKEESWYDDSNFYSNPFEDLSDDEDDFVKPMKRSSSYDILGIDEDSEDEDIKKAFRKKALIHHPDKGGDPEEFRKVREAYEILIN